MQVSASVGTWNPHRAMPNASNDPSNLISGQPPPNALQPPVTLGQPNEPIVLYSRPAELTQNNRTFQTDVQISLTWLPRPRIRFDVPMLPSGVLPALDKDLALRLEDGTTISRGLLTGLTHSIGSEGSIASLHGIIGERVVRPADADAGYALFLLPNFDQPLGDPVAYPDGGRSVHRLTLQGGGWKIVLDAVDNYKTVRESLDANSGFAITQVGRLERNDGKPFTAQDATAPLGALAWYLSFARGRWTGPCLPTGFNTDDKRAWQIWEVHRTVAFAKRLSWLDGIHGEQFTAPFAGFTKLWFDATWEDVIRVAMHWYIEANAQAGSIEGSIVLTQTAFELLASAVLAENYGWLSSEGYDKLSAADRIRLLFLWAGIPTDIPAELVDLVKLAKAYEEFMVNKRPDNAAAMATIRNTITHPTKKNREKFGKHPGEARTNAWVLGLWALELCLLRLFDYDGTYANRITQRFVGEIERVPWG
jgi:hypothetical protein